MIFNNIETVVTDSNSNSNVKKILIVGLPNSGKSQIFNNLTGEYTLVANYPLTTVESKRTFCEIHGQSCEVIDTPGLHCLYIHSEEELIVRDMIFFERFDVIVQCIDANYLKQSLILTSDLLELGMPVVVVLNAIDETTRKGIWVDSSGLSKLLGCPVVESVAIQNMGTDKLKGAIINAQNVKHGIHYGDVIEDSISALESILPDDIYYKRKASILMLLKDPFYMDNLRKVYGEDNVKLINNKVNMTTLEFKGNLSKVINIKRNKWIDNIIDNAIRKQKLSLGNTNQTFAHLSRHPLFGIPILISFIAILYFLVVNVANVTARWMELTLWLPVQAHIDGLVSNSYINEFLIGEYGVLSLGLANALITILPILSVFFLFFNILEDIGYIPNLSVLVKRVFEKVGLSGSAIMPLVLSFGCKTMATLTTKSIRSKKERYIAICLIAFGIPCAAQLGINISILGRIGISAFAITFLVLILLDVLVAFSLNKLLKEEDVSFFIQELPAMRLPRPKAVLIKTYYRLYWFLKEALPVFVFASAALFLADKIGVLDGMKTILSPIIEGFLGFPPQMVDVLIICIARHEAAAAMIINLLDKGLLNYVQCITAVTIIMMLPCFANIGAMIKELGLKSSLIMVTFIYMGAFLVAGSLNWTLVSVFGL